MRVLVCGGRNYGLVHAEKKRIYNALDELHGDCWPSEEYPLGKEPPKITHVISGGATGADSVAIDWAVVNWVPCTEYKADWKKYGRKAGPIRNKQMLDEGKPDLVLAFPGGPGTENMVLQALQANIKVVRK